ncbi:tachykinin receptor, putative [Ixodes scapularis]|uniref:Tachykinin receptor, putative n=1 Tax=Ixodes scapularis TaxID=6945 RepID=B7PNP6_IXOSC|nr:tachykinin receptor, putative [Ixodes scapularis]|eukprot:XP_002435388.1 tachykinin receptor, putative [Ixodes scapularis]
MRYNVVFLVLTYVVPVTTMIATYTRMSMILWGSRFIGEFTQHQHKALQSKRKVVKMLSTVVTLFTVSWLPYHLYFLYVFHHPNVAYVDSIQHVYLAMYWLAMSHAMYNPMVYYLMNRRFRHYFRMFLRGSCASTWLETRPSLSITPASRWGTRRGTDKFYPGLARGPEKLQDDRHYLNRKFTMAHGKATNGDVLL